MISFSSDLQRLAIVNYFLPDVSKCTWDYLIAVCDGTRKKHITRDNLCGKRVPGYQELKIKNCFHDITGQVPEILDYLPDVGKRGELPP